MISPDLAAAPPQPPSRVVARPAGEPTPEHAFAAFLDGGADLEADAGPVVPDLVPPPTVALTAAPLLALALAPPPAPPPALAPPPGLAPAPALAPPPAPAPAPGAEGDAEAETAPAPSTSTVASAGPPTGATPAVALLPPASSGAKPELAPAALEPDTEPEPETTPRAQATTPLAVGAEGRPQVSAPPPMGFDLALQPPGAQSWRLSAVAAHAAETDRAPAPAPVPRDVATQITVAIAQSTQPQLEIRLDPPELGRVQIRLNPTEHGMQALVTAERPETQDFLRRHAEVLVRELTDAGYANVSLDFAAGGEAAPRDAPADTRRFDAAFTAPAVLPAPEAPARVVAGGLDIRL